jgi:hypothetical protein
MARGRRVRLEAGIYRDALGLAAVVTGPGQRQEKRFDADTDLQQLRIWRADTTSALLKRSQLTSDRGTLAREVARFLRSRKGRPSYKADRSHLRSPGSPPSVAAAAIRSPARASSSCSPAGRRRPARRGRSGTACACCAKSRARRSGPGRTR